MIQGRFVSATALYAVGKLSVDAIVQEAAGLFVTDGYNSFWRRSNRYLCKVMLTDSGFKVVLSLTFASTGSAPRLQIR
ncbi:hypothetical protein F511_01531 [Dorcoceras hygrometricum]|nr:hypothetical protein F511_01531 [Dorcoceras hygrometricum]